MHRFLNIFVYVVLFSFTIAAPSNKQSKNDTFKMIILHNNDMHARFEQTNAYSSHCKEEDEKNNKCYGGFARVAHLVREYRKKADLGEIPKVLYLNAGDTYTGTPWFSLFKDNITATFLDLLKPDAISLGNHEFDEGTENLAQFLNEINFPVLAANLILDEEPELKNEHLKPSHIFDIENTKVGVIGYLTPETKDVAIPNKVEFIDEIEAINKEANRLKSQGVNIIIALGHSGIERDKEIAKFCPEIDLVIGGHSHTFLYSGTPPDIENPYDIYPVTVVQTNGKHVPVVQTYAYTKYLGYLHLEFDSAGKLLEIDGTPILLNGTIEREKDVLQMLEVYRPALLELQNQIVGHTKVHLDGSCRRRECNLGNFIADSMVDWNAIIYQGAGWTDAAIGMIQGGGVRSSIEKNSKGITMEDLSTVLPFGSKVVVIEITGTQLLSALEHSVHRYTDGEERGEFLQYSGLFVEYDMNKPPGSRVINTKVLCAYCEVPQLEALNSTKKYRIVVQDFLANGGDGFEMFKGTQIHESEALDIDVSLQYLRKKSPIYPAIEWRITIKDYIDPSHEIVGSTRVYLDGNCYRSECNLGNFITDAMIDWYSLNHETPNGWTNASITLVPASNIKHSIDNKVNNGTITKKDATDILPLNSKIAIVNVSGKILLEMLEHSVHRYDEGAQPSEFLQVSGIQVEYDFNNRIGSRVVSVKVLCSSCTVPLMNDLKLEETYNILIPENVAEGSLGFTMLRNHIVQIFNETELDAFIQYLGRKSPIYPSVEWRITLNHFDPLKDVVGNTRVLLSNECTLEECNFGNFITDSFVDWYAQDYKGMGWTDSSIAIVQGVKIKSMINASSKNGDIYRTDVEKVFDPPYNLQMITMKGSDFISLLEYSISSYGDSKYQDFLQLSGVQVTFDLKEPAGNRIADIKVMCSSCDVPILVPVNLTESYNIIVQSSLISDEYHDIVLGNEVKDLNETDINVFLQYLKKKSPIYPAVEWRITILEDPEQTTTSLPTTTLAASHINVSLTLIYLSIFISFFSLKFKGINL